MKRLIFSALVVVTFFSAACGKKDENANRAPAPAPANPVPQNNIPGSNCPGASGYGSAITYTGNLFLSQGGGSGYYGANLLTLSVSQTAAPQYGQMSSTIVAGGSIQAPDLANIYGPTNAPNAFAGCVTSVSQSYFDVRSGWIQGMVLRGTMALPDRNTMNGYPSQNLVSGQVEVRLGSSQQCPTQLISQSSFGQSGNKIVGCALVIINGGQPVPFQLQ